MTELLQQLPGVRGTYRVNAELKNWFNVGGRAEILFRPADINDLRDFLKNCPKQIPITILGAASNVIICDEGVRGVVIRLPGEFSKIFCEGDLVKVGAAALCGNVALHGRDSEIGNLEFLTGIPGSIGGAIAMNAGCYGSDISQILISASAIDFAGNVIEFKNHEFDFFYRGSELVKNSKERFFGGLVFVEAVLQGKKSTSEIISQKILELNKQREAAQPIRAKTGGSTFKNLVDSERKAWQLIDDAGCRGMVEGDAQMSEKHCNFMINRGKASAKNLVDLVSKVQKLVRESSGVDLVMEIKVIK